MGKPVSDLIGKIFERLTVVERVGSRRGFALWLCRCSCGGQKEITTGQWGKTKSCGCLRIEMVRKALKRDLSGRRFGRMVARTDVSKGTGGRTRWLCECDCGNWKEVPSGSLVSKQVQSCGCLGKENRIKRNTIHGQARRGHQTPEFVMWNSAKQRAKKRNIPFTIKLGDVHIPERCPIFGTLFHTGTRAAHNDSPSLDCRMPTLGYVLGNTWVISWRANRIKSDATLEELEAIVKVLRSQCGESD